MKGTEQKKKGTKGKSKVRPVFSLANTYFFFTWFGHPFHSFFSPSNSFLCSFRSPVFYKRIFMFVWLSLHIKTFSIYIICICHICLYVLGYFPLMFELLMFIQLLIFNLHNRALSFEVLNTVLLINSISFLLAH